MADGVATRHDGPVTTVTLARPDKRNALSSSVLELLHQALCDVPESTHVVVLDAQGPVFSAGHDLTELVGRDGEFYGDLFRRCSDVMLTIRSMPQPVIAKVQGVATAAGCQLVAACDLAVAADTATFATPGVKIGLFCSTPMVPLSRSVSPKRAMQMLLTGEPIDAATAADWGLINEAVPADELDAAVQRFVDQILRFSSATIGVGKVAFHQQLALSEDAAYELTVPVMRDNAVGADAQEGISAFLDKREPNWG